MMEFICGMLNLIEVMAKTYYKKTFGNVFNEKANDS